MNMNSHYYFLSDWVVWFTLHPLMRRSISDIFKDPYKHDKDMTSLRMRSIQRHRIRPGYKPFSGILSSALPLRRWAILRAEFNKKWFLILFADHQGNHWRFRIETRINGSVNSIIQWSDIETRKLQNAMKRENAISWESLFSRYINEWSEKNVFATFIDCTLNANLYRINLKKTLFVNLLTL